MSRLTIAALSAAVATSAIALFDALTRAITGVDSVFADGSAHPAVALAGGVVHIACYALIVAVLFTAAAQVFDGRPWRNTLRWALAIAYGTMAIGMAVGLFGVEPNGVMGIAVTIGFFAMLVLPGVLGITLLVQRDRSVAAWLLMLALPAMVLMFVLPEMWAHPGYAEAFSNVGLALLGTPAAVAAGQPGRLVARGA